MPSETFYRFEGGPLDGQERKKTRPARRPIFMTTDGDPMPTPRGDRILNARSGLARRPKVGPFACYAARGPLTVEEGRVLATYVYITIDSEETLTQ